MARSWDELSTDHKIVFLLESLVQKQEQRAPIACRLCEEIFFDNKSLLNHFQSHFHSDGTLDPSSLVRNSVSPEKNEIKRSSSSSRFINHIAKHVSSNRAKLSISNSSLSTPSQNPVQLRDPTLTHKNQSHQSVSRSSLKNGPSASVALVELQNVHSLIGPKTPAVSTSKITEGPKSHFPVKPVTSNSRGFSQPMTVAKPSQSVPSASLSLGKRPRTAVEIEVKDPLAGYTKPYIKKLEQPIKEMMGVSDNMNNDDELDLTLKL